MVAHPAGDFLEQRLGFDAVIQTIYEMSKEPGWWELSGFWRSLDEETRNL